MAYPPHVNLQPSKSTPGYDLKLEDFLGGAETFKPVLRSCYGLPISLNPNNVAALRCASEVLEMTEALKDGNLISKTEAFLTFVVLSSWRDFITVHKSCGTLSPLAENPPNGKDVLRLNCLESFPRKSINERCTN